MNIYFARHGQTNWNKRLRLQGQVDIPLAIEGIQQAEVTAEGMAEIPFDCIFTSPLKRASATAAILRNGRDIPIIKDERLKEMGFGIAEGRLVHKIKENPALVRYQRLFNDPAHFHPLKHGERFESLLKRTDEFFKEEILPLEGKMDNILIIAHGCVIRSFLVNLNHRSLDDFWKTPFGKNCSTALFECQGGQVTMIYENKLYYQQDV